MKQHRFHHATALADCSFKKIYPSCTCKFAWNLRICQNWHQNSYFSFSLRLSSWQLHRRNQKYEILCSIKKSKVLSLHNDNVLLIPSFSWWIASHSRRLVHSLVPRLPCFLWLCYKLRIWLSFRLKPKIKAGSQPSQHEIKLSIKKPKAFPHALGNPHTIKCTCVHHHHLNSRTYEEPSREANW